MLEALVTVFLLGLLSSLHCGGMCGGIIGALSISLPAEVRSRPLVLIGYHLLFNGGRIGSYALAGALVGSLSTILPDAQLAQVLGYARMAVGVLMILLALHLTGVLRTMSAIERLGLGLWRRISPLYRPLLPVRKPWQAVALGLFWGWLPCGLVYTALAYTLTVPGPAQGAQLMAAFGLGTLPALLLTGTAFSTALRTLPATRPAMGILLLVLGVWTIYAALPHADHAPHHHSPQEHSLQNHQSEPPATHQH